MSRSRGSPWPVLATEPLGAARRRLDSSGIADRLRFATRHRRLAGSLFGRLDRLSGRTG